VLQDYCRGAVPYEYGTRIHRLFHSAGGKKVPAMKLSLIDWCVIGGYFLFNIAIGLYYKARAGKNMSEFFLGGRNIPWWLAGTSMVATTFAADTPLAVTGFVARNGIAGNWLWWNSVASGMLTVFLFARLWRRAGVMTDVEFAELRYSGKPAAILRGFRALYLGIPINCIILGWVNLAMVKILMLILGVTKLQALTIVLGLIALTSAISVLSGLWGVLVTDMFQFAVKMSMVIVLAVVAVQAVGGVDQMKAKLAVIDHAKGLSTGTAGSALSFVPDLNSAWMPMITFLVYISINWWATWYPGAEPGGGGYIAQRMFSAKNERHSLLATLWFNIAHYAIRPWPWVLVGLASIILYPNLADPETGYIRVLIDYLPPYLRGLMVAAFLAAYMSTIGTQLNWGASYLVNDFYRRFWKPNETDRHYVTISQWSTVLLTIVSAVVTFYMDSIAGAWKLLIVTGAGTGTVLILRWYWWRINAWSEVSAMAAAFIVSVVLQTAYGMNSDDPVQFAHIMLITVGITTAVWLATTFLTAPEPQAKLLSFYRKVRPSVFGWKPIAKLAPEIPPSHDFGWNLLDWLCGCVLIYGTLFGTGKIILKETGLGLFFLACAALAGATIYWDLNRRGWKTVAE
jgi:solute:Na+ symporter, SSS family